MIQFFPSRRIFLSIGNLSIAWYAVCILAGFLVAYAITVRNLKKMKYPSSYADDLFINVMWTGIVGARLWFCIFYDFSYYLSNPIEIISIWDGGLAIQGGLVLALVYNFIWAKRHGLDFLRLLDAVLPNVLLAQALGRWGNFANQECFGFEVSESYYDGILSFIKDGMHINGTYYEPMFLYESVLCVIGFILIVFILKRFQNKRGDLGWAYLLWYGLIRFFIEGHRQDSLMFGPLRMAQVTSIFFLIIGVLGFIGIFDRFLTNKKPTIIFDLDGTLLDTESGILETYRYLFAKYQRSELFTKEVELEVLGPALQDIFKKYFSDIDTETLVEEYRDYNKAIFVSKNKPMANAEKVLKSLKEENYHIGIVSTKMKETVINNLKAFNLDTYIDDVVGYKEVTKQKPDPEGLNKILADNRWQRDQLIYIGDSVTDIEAGKNVGAYTIGYYFNEDRKEALENAKANEYIDDLNEILRIIKDKHNFTYDLT